MNIDEDIYINIDTEINVEAIADMNLAVDIHSRNIQI